MVAWCFESPGEELERDTLSPSIDRWWIETLVGELGWYGILSSIARWCIELQTFSTTSSLATSSLYMPYKQKKNCV